jgi:hypothetical protein
MQKYTLEQFEAYRKEQDAKSAIEEERQERTEKQAASRAWVADGGNARDFERAWPRHRDEARRRRVMEADSRR